jgi:DNA-binding NarL/FixJ family response regulator
MIAPVAGSVLVVDDDAVFRRLAERLLAAFGLSVAGEADTAEAALSAATALRPDSMLVDVGLPDRDGVSLAGDLVLLPWRPRVVLTSSDPDAASPGDVRRIGVEAFVPKADLPNAALHRLLGAREA